MAIRIKNLDLEAPGMRRSVEYVLGDLTANRNTPFFVAPLACRVDFIDIYTLVDSPPQANTASVTSFGIQFRRENSDATSSLVAMRTGSANGISHTDNYLARTRNRFIPSANNSLSVGAWIEMQNSAQGSGNLSQVVAVVHYTPLIHRETR